MNAAWGPFWMAQIFDTQSKWSAMQRVSCCPEIPAVSVALSQGHKATGISCSRDHPFRGMQTEGKKGFGACGKRYLVPKFRRDLYLQLYHAVPLG